MQETLSLTEILAVFVKKAKTVIILAILVAVFLGGFQFVKQILLKFTDVDNTVYQESLEKYQKQLDTLTTNLAVLETKVESQKEYNENSIVMKLNPFNVAVSTTVFQISGIDDLLSQPKYSSEAFTTTYFINTIQNQYNQYLRTMDYKKIFPEEYSDISEKYLQEIVAFEVNGSGSFSINVYERDIKKAEKLGKAISNYILSVEPLVNDTTFAHNLSYIDTTTKVKLVSSFDNIQKSNKDVYNSYVTEKENLQNQLDELVEPKDTSKSGKNIKNILISTAKWIILGAIVGAVLACAFIFVLMLFKNIIISSRQMESLLGIAFLGSVAKKGDICNILANKLLSERIWENETVATEYISENLKTVSNKEAEILVASTLNVNGIDEDIAVISKTASPLYKKVYTVSNAEKNPEMIATLGSCKYMILAERVGKSELVEMLSIIEMAKHKGVEVIGFVTI